MSIREKGNEYKCAHLYEYQEYNSSTKPLAFVPWNKADSLSYRSNQNRDKSKIVIKLCQGGRKTHRLKSGKIRYFVPKLLSWLPGSHAVRHMSSIQHQAQTRKNTKQAKLFGHDRAFWYIT